MQNSFDVPSFAVIIPVYNGDPYLTDSIESALAQTWPAREIIVIDDGSPRSSDAIASRFSGRIRYISRSHHGVSATRNYGASLTSATWLSFLDHDDVWLPDHLERQAEAILKTPGVGFCYSNRRLLIEDIARGGWQLDDPRPLPSPEDLPGVLLDRCPFTPSSVSIRRSTFDELGGFRSQHDLCEDWDMWLRLQRHGASGVHVAEPTIHYRVHAEMNSNSAIRILQQNVGVVRDSILRYMPAWKRQAHGRKIISRLESEASILLRETHQPGALRMMLHSLVRHPLHAPRRYKIAAHMMLFGTVV